MTSPSPSRDSARSTTSRSILLALLAIAPVFAASLIGQAATMPNIPTWYAGLVKPSFNPPNWIFGPVWTTLYVMMAYAFWRVLRLPGETPGRGGAITLFLLQIALNAAWSWAFFGFHSPLSGVFVIAALWLAIVATMVAFWRLDRLAGWLFAPYIAWVSFAAVLNVSILQLNP
jgi:tryptophan-rich sensory protein